MKPDLKIVPDFEMIICPPAESFRWNMHDYPYFGAKWHYHPEYELHLTRTTSGVMMVGDHIGEFEPGCLVLTQLGDGDLIAVDAQGVCSRPVPNDERLGGNITGEHGIGMAKKSFLPKFAGDAQMRVMRELRRALDPNGILNPGKMFDP